MGPPKRHKHTHIHTHRHTHARTHRHTQTHTHRHTHTHTYTHTHLCACSNDHTHNRRSNWRLIHVCLSPSVGVQLHANKLIKGSLFISLTITHTSRCYRIILGRHLVNMGGTRAHTHKHTHSQQLQIFLYSSHTVHDDGELVFPT